MLLFSLIASHKNISLYCPKYDGSMGGGGGLVVDLRWQVCSRCFRRPPCRATALAAVSKIGQPNRLHVETPADSSNNESVGELESWRGRQGRPSLNRPVPSPPPPGHRCVNCNVIATLNYYVPPLGLGVGHRDRNPIILCHPLEHHNYDRRRSPEE